VGRDETGLGDQRMCAGVGQRDEAPIAWGPVVSGSGRETGRAWASLRRKRSGTSPEARYYLGFIQINFKQVQTNLVKKGTYQTPKILNKIWVKRDRDKEQHFL
jgi:hypothetical protein